MHVLRHLEFEAGEKNVVADGGEEESSKGLVTSVKDNARSKGGTLTRVKVSS